MQKSMYAEIRRKAGSPPLKVDELFADLPPAELHELASALRPIEIAPRSPWRDSLADD